MQANMVNSSGLGILSGVTLHVPGRDERTTGDDSVAVNENAADAAASIALSVANAGKWSASFGQSGGMRALDSSRYIQGLMTSLGVAEQMRTAAMAGGMNLLDKANCLSALQGASGMAEWESEYVKAIHQQHEVEKLARSEEAEKTVKASKRNLKEVREDIERAAEGETPGKPRTEADAAKEKNGTEAASEKNGDEEAQAGAQPEETAADKTESLLETLHRVRKERSVLTRTVASRAYAAEQNAPTPSQADPGVDITA